MKIYGPSELFRYVDRVQARGDGDASQGQQGKNKRHPEHEQTDKNEQGETEGAPVNGEKVDAAIASFDSDQQAKANGLHAERTGNGPGLKVVLKDTNGEVVRQYSGDEFLKLRDNASKDFKARGKLLDRKL